MSKANNRGVGHSITATVISIKGKCNAGHKIGDRFNIGCHDTGGLCGYFYHDLFPKLSVMQFGGRYPWWDENQTVFEYECQDKKNLVTLRLEIVN